MTTAPPGIIEPIISDALISGERSGRLALSIGVGTVTIKTRQSRRRFRVGGKTQMPSLGKFCCRDLEGFIMSFIKSVNPRRPCVEADNRTLLAEFDCKRQPHVTEADHGNFGLL